MRDASDLDLHRQRGVSMLESILFLALFFAAVVASIQFFQNAAERRAQEGVRSYQSYDLPPPPG